jgi:putative tryptophan/tyrosine transport system substrate-binding protein
LAFWEGFMQRREFIAGLGGAAAWPISAPAQQLARPRQIGMLIPFDANDPQVKARLSAFKQRLHELGWIESRNIRLDYRFTGQDTERIRTGTGELIALGPDVIVAWSNPAVAIVQKATQTIPIVFVGASDPVESGFVTNIARPGGNITGFQNFETALGGKWLDLLKEIAPGVRRVAFVYSPDISANAELMHSAEGASTSLGVTMTGAAVQNIADVEHALTAFAKEPNGGVILGPFPFIATNRERIIALVSDLHLPAIYPFRYFATNGGLASYGFDTVEPHRAAASYVDRILKGEKPGNLPVQAPTKYELVINLKTAKTLGLDVSPQLLLRADEVIE